MVTGAKKRRYGPAQITLLVALSIICFTMLYPFINTLFVSLSAMHEVIESNGMMLYPKSVQLDAYRYIFGYAGIKRAFQNTIFITIVGTLIALVVMYIGAYVLSKKDLVGRGFFTAFIVLTMFVSGGLIPTYINMRNLGLTNSLWVLILPQAVSTWYMLLIRNFISAIPQELSEAAKIDGASELTLMVRIILPLCTSIIATIALFQGVGRWNEYTNAVIYNSKEQYITLQVIIKRLFAVNPDAMEYDALPPATESVRSAAIIVVSVPILCVYPFLQKYFAQGVMVGSIKG